MWKNENFTEDWAEFQTLVVEVLRKVYYPLHHHIFFYQEATSLEEWLHWPLTMISLLRQADKECVCCCQTLLWSCPSVPLSLLPSCSEKSVGRLPSFPVWGPFLCQPHAWGFELLPMISPTKQDASLKGIRVGVGHIKSTAIPWFALSFLHFKFSLT